MHSPTDRHRTRLAVLLTVVAAACAGGTEAPPVPTQLTVPVDNYTLANGLKVVLSRDTTVQTRRAKSTCRTWP